MAKFAVMRCEKISTKGAVAASLEHNTRERETKNADKTQSQYNKNVMGRSAAESMAVLQERLDTLARKPRKDAVLAVEYVFSYSKEWGDDPARSKSEKYTDERGEFFNRAKAWAEEKYGKENVLGCVLHQDEQTPHMHLHVVPITRDGRLSAKDHIGNKTKLREDQSSFAEKVKDLGLERGLSRTGARHQTVQQFYAQLEHGKPVEMTMPTADYENDRKGRKEFQERVAEVFTPQVKGKKGMFSKEYETPNEVMDRAFRELGYKHHVDKALAQVGRFKGQAQKEKARADRYAVELSKRPALPKNVSLKEIQAHIDQLSKDRRIEQYQLEKKLGLIKEPVKAQTKAQTKGKSRGFSR